jgi:hypothetical protein
MWQERDGGNIRSSVLSLASRLCRCHVIFVRVGALPPALGLVLQLLLRQAEAVGHGPGPEANLRVAEAPGAGH